MVPYYKLGYVDVIIRWMFSLCYEFYCGLSMVRQLGWVR
jgi:hypothetical protein